MTRDEILNDISDVIDLLNMDSFEWVEEYRKGHPEAEISDVNALKVADTVSRLKQIIKSIIIDPYKTQISPKA